jgi:hypothetical protein
MNRGHFRATVLTRRDNDGAVSERYWGAECQDCLAMVSSARTGRWVRWWLRLHPLYCRGYYFPPMEDTDAA